MRKTEYPRCSFRLLRVTHSGNGSVLSSNIAVDLFVSKSGIAGFDVILLAHLEVLAEVLVSAPPVSVDHTNALVSAHLMEVSVADIILVTISRHSTVTCSKSMLVVSLSNVPSPVLNHLLLLVLDKSVEEEGLVEMESEADPHEADAVSFMEGVHFPVNVTNGILKEASNVLESSPSLGIISRFLCVVNKFGEITVGFFCECSKKGQIKLLNFGYLIYNL